MEEVMDTANSFPHPRLMGNSKMTVNGQKEADVITYTCMHAQQLVEIGRGVSMSVCTPQKSKSSLN